MGNSVNCVYLFWKKDGWNLNSVVRKVVISIDYEAPNLQNVWNNGSNGLPVMNALLDIMVGYTSWLKAN